MNKNFEKKAAIALLTFTVLMIFTMVLHPAGGSFAYLQKVSTRIIVTHAIALLSLPFGLVGFWGLTKKLGTDNFFSVTGFSFICFGLFAVMMAAATNGLVLPIFIEKYSSADQQTIDTLRPVLRYSFSVNETFDYIYTAAFSLAIIAWSVAILATKKLPAWIAWLGILLSVIILFIFISGFSVVSLRNFRIFVMGIVLWIILTAVSLMRHRAFAEENKK